MNDNRLIIKNGTIVDGSGKKSFKGDVLIEDGIIKTVGKIPDSVEGTRIEAVGKIVTPGFFDSHRHCDYALMDESFGTIELSQGITSAVTGSCGLTPFPLPENAGYKSQLSDLLTPCLGNCKSEKPYRTYRDFADYLKTSPLPVNIGNLIGSCSVRIAVKGFDDSPLTKREMELVKGHITEALENGAMGLSMGLMYYPEYYYREEELIEVARSASAYDSILTCHIRGEGDGLLPSLKEIIKVAEAAEIPLQISHLKSCGMKNWGKDIYRAMELIEHKRAEGMDIMVDFYPYHGGSTTLLSLIPPSYMKATLEETWDYMGKPKGVSELREKLSKTYEKWDNYVLSLGYDKIVISSCMLPHNKCMIGKNISEIAAQYDIDPVDFICRIMAQEKGKVGIIVMSMSPADVDEIAKLPYSYLISDALYSDLSNPHPRLFGAFPKMIRDFVMERKILTLEEAIAKMTYMPAKRLKATGRGLIKEGYFADVNIFSPENIRDNATFESPAKLAAGMDYVIVNGDIAWQEEQLSSRKSGRFLGKKTI